jgi:hypothetical protein
VPFYTALVVSIIISTEVVDTIAFQALLPKRVSIPALLYYPSYFQGHSVEVFPYCERISLIKLDSKVTPQNAHHLKPVNDPFVYRTIKGRI